MTERMPPHSLEAEKAVLGAALSSRKAWPTVATTVSASEFYRGAHADIFRTIEALASVGVEPDLVTVGDALIKAGKLEEVGGPAYLASLVDGVPHTANAQAYAEIVRDKARFRSLMSAAAWVAEQAALETGVAAELAAAGADRILRTVLVTDRASTAHEAAQSYVDGLLSSDARPALESGLKELDAITGIARRGELTIIAGRPSNGKTSLALGMARHLAGSGLSAAYVSSGTSRKALAARLLAWGSGQAIEAIEGGQADEAAYASLSTAAAIEYPLTLAGPARTLAEAAAWVRRLAADGAVYAVIDDLRGILPAAEAGRDRMRSDDLAAGNAGELLKGLADRLGIAIVAVSPMLRPPENRADKRPHLTELGRLGEAADCVALVFREELYKRKKGIEGWAEVIVAKNHWGPTALVRALFDKKLARFGSPEPVIG
jgi:replicative DNA helicase